MVMGMVKLARKGRFISTFSTVMNMKKIMEIKNIFEIEVEGMCKTIIQYTNDEYVKSYAHKLMELEYPKDKSVIKMLVDRLSSWYLTEIEEIKNSQYIVNKKSHIKTFELIQDTKDQLSIGV